MKKIVAIFGVCLIFVLNTSTVFAITNPLAVTNNIFGIHILFPQELDNAAHLVNSNGGDWGYVVIPIQSGDKDLLKWQTFMDNAKKLHIIPIIRLATEGDYFNTKVWRKPIPADVLDFANFLNSLTWPTKNRYIIVYNEVNRGDEWGGTPNPKEYAQLLSYTYDVFKQRSDDFFIISAGMDNAAATTSQSMNEYTYLAQMNTDVPGIFNKIDGIGSHSYPNPGFSQPPNTYSRTNVDSFQFEKNLIEGHADKDLPVFITETGWDQNVIGQNLASQYMKLAYTTIWKEKGIVVVAPFLLQAGGGPFTGFSLYKTDGSKSMIYNAIADLPKEKGAPKVASPEAKIVLAANTSSRIPTEEFKSLHFSSLFPTSFEKNIKYLFKWLLHVQ